jgi:transcription antitermination protein NusB
MALPQQKFREIVLQVLFSYDFLSSHEEEIIPMMMSEVSISKKIALEASQRALQILDKRQIIDELIAKASTAYAFDRIQNVEKNVLRMGVYELLYDPNVPPKVVISEAIRLSRKFSTPESANFINAILDSILKQHTASDEHAS